MINNENHIERLAMLLIAMRPHMPGINVDSFGGASDRARDMVRTWLAPHNINDVPSQLHAARLAVLALADLLNEADDVRSAIPSVVEAAYLLGREVQRQDFNQPEVDRCSATLEGALASVGWPVPAHVAIGNAR